MQWLACVQQPLLRHWPVWPSCSHAAALVAMQMIDNSDVGSSAMSDIDPYWDLRSSEEKDRLDPFRDRDQFWRK